jgi:hypothetical protein
MLPLPLVLGDTDSSCRRMQSMDISLQNRSAI